MSIYTSEQTVYTPLKMKYVPMWRLDTNTVTVTHFNVDTHAESNKTFFIRYTCYPTKQKSKPRKIR